MKRACIGCGKLISRGSRCRACQYRTGSTRQWRNVRAMVLNRDGRRCRYCGGRADTVDHILPKVRGGTDDPANLVASCEACNKRKGSR